MKLDEETLRKIQLAADNESEDELPNLTEERASLGYRARQYPQAPPPELRA